MRSRELSLLPDVYPVAVYRSTTMDTTLSSGGVVASGQWTVQPKFVGRRGRTYFTSLTINLACATDNPFRLSARFTGDDGNVVSGGVVDTGNSYKPGRASEPWTLVSLPRFIYQPGGVNNFPVGPTVVDLVVTQGTSLRLLALTGIPVVLTVWEAPTAWIR